MRSNSLFFGKKKSLIDCQELHLEKENLFASNRKKGLFFYLAHQLYGDIVKKFESFCKIVSIIHLEN